MKFNNVEYDAQVVANTAGTGPSIELAVQDINLSVVPELKKPMVVKQPVFFKFEGKYVVLLGHEIVHQAIVDKQVKFKGKLISTPMLKKAKLGQEPAYQEPVNDRGDFANRPRFTYQSDRSRDDYAERGHPRRPHPTTRNPRFG